MPRKKKNQQPVSQPVQMANVYVERVESYVSRDPSVWTKTLKEKKILKTQRRIHKHSLKSKTSAPWREIPVYGKVILYLKLGPLDKENFKSTVSFKCGQADIPEIVNKRKNQLIKYFWNGRTYFPGEFPFWH